MKILNIFGFVVAVHIAVLVIAFAVPGCSSTDTTANPVSAEATPMGTSPSPVTPAGSSAGRLADADLNPAISSAPPPTFDPNAPARATATGVRASPTRPSGNTSLVPQSIPLATPMATAPATAAPISYTVVRGDSLWAVAKRHNISVRELATANDLSTSAMLQLGQVLLIPAHALPEPTSSETDAAAGTPYTIQPGDTLARIANRNGTTVAKLKAFNQMTGDMVRAGDTLMIPDATTTEPAPATTAATTTPTAAEATSAPASPGSLRHTVAAGETLSVIARRYGVRLGDIALENKIADPSLIRPGQELVIPGVQAPTPAATPPAPTRPAGTPAANVPAADQDLDAGLSDQGVDIPVLEVDEEEVPTLNFGDEPATTEGEPPRFN